MVKKKKPVPYPQEVIDEAWELFKANTTIRSIAKKLSIPRAQTVQSWINKFHWHDRRHKIETQARQKADEKAIDELAKSKAEYRTENLTVTDKIKFISNEYLTYCMNEIELAKREDSLNNSRDKLTALLSDPKFQEKFKLGAKETRETVKVQDSMLFGNAHSDDGENIDYGKAIAAIRGVSENPSGSGEEP